MSAGKILEVKHLVTVFETENGPVRAVDGVSFSLEKGDTLGIVGESGCGKSVTALSVMRLLPRPVGRIESGDILFDGIHLTELTPDEMSRIRGKRIAMIFQEPMTSLNPVHRIGKQIGEVFRLHFPEMPPSEIEAESLAMLKKVGIPEPRQRLREYPHQISGGMRQRVMIAIALACKPDILIADEPTTALDVTIQAQILELIGTLQKETGMSVIFITHDLGVIAETCNEVLVMYAGQAAEQAPVGRLFSDPRHPYTRGLLSSIPRLEHPRKTHLDIIRGMVPALDQLPEGCRFQNRCPHVQDICQNAPELVSIEEDHFAACHFSQTLPPFERILPATPSPSDKAASDEMEEVIPKEAESVCLKVEDLTMHFPVQGGVFLRQVATVHAVDGISFSIQPGRTLGLVGESGCGKTTAGRCILRLYEPTGGKIHFYGKNVLTGSSAEVQKLRREIQMIFQDPYESLNSRHTVGDILEEPFIIQQVGTPESRREEICKLLEKVGLPQNAVSRFPHEFSGGQRQRIGIARAIALTPQLIVCDEPVSALDVSIQSQILNLLMTLQKEMNLTYLFISHDLTVVRHISDHIAVMYLGKIVEYTDADTIYRQPLHPYTQALLSAIPVPDPGRKQEKQVLSGDVPSPVHPPSGCRFRTRCPICIERCIHEEPRLVPAPGVKEGAVHTVACHRVSE